jgi:hypothetical protein
MAHIHVRRGSRARSLYIQQNNNAFSQRPQEKKKLPFETAPFTSPPG